MHLKAEPLLKATHTATTASTSWFRKPMTRTELVAISSSEDEGNLRFVYELLSWVEEMQVGCVGLKISGKQPGGEGLYVGHVHICVLKIFGHEATC